MTEPFKFLKHELEELDLKARSKVILVVPAGGQSMPNVG